MSNTGLYSGMYQLVYETATLVDRALIGLKTGNGSGRVACEQLGQLLLSIASNEDERLHIQLLAMKLKSNLESQPVTWQEVGRALLDFQLTQHTVPFLEELARALEQEQIQSLARMHEDP